jgi:hypothetical protein
VYVSPQAAAAANLPLQRPVGNTYPNVGRMYAEMGRRSETYRVTGGMWRGLQVRGSGRVFILDFGGTSEGRGRPILVRRKDGSRGKVLVAVASDRVRNRWKGGAIHQRHGVHVLLPTQSEVDQLGATVLQSVQRRVSLVLGS